MSEADLLAGGAGAVAARPAAVMAGGARTSLACAAAPTRPRHRLEATLEALATTASVEKPKGTVRGASVNGGREGQDLLDNRKIFMIQ